MRKTFTSWSGIKRRVSDEELLEWTYRLNERLGIMGYASGEKIDPNHLAIAIAEADEALKKDLSIRSSGR